MQFQTKPLILTSLLSFSLSLAAADTLTVTTFNGDNCSNELQSFTIGNIQECHDTTEFNSIQLSNIAQSFFGRDLILGVFTNSDCSGVFDELDLTNDGVCYGNTAQSFIIGSR